MTLTAERAFESNVTELPYERLNDFLAFRRVVLADDRQQVAIRVSEAKKEEVLAGAKIEELLQSAYAAGNSGNYQAAIELLDQVVNKEPDHKSAYNDLGRFYLALHQLDKAQQALEKAIELNPYSEYAHNNLGRVYWQQRRYDLAEKSFRKQIEVSPLDKFAHRSLGDMFLEQKKYADAEAELDKAVSILHNDPFALVELGSAQINNGKSEKAQESFDKAAELAPSPGIWNNIAYQLAEHKLNLDRARRYAEQAVTMTATNLRNVRLDTLQLQNLGSVGFLAMTWDTLGWVHFQQRNLVQAEKYLQAAWNLGQHAASADHLGQVYEQKGDKTRAAEMYAMAQASPYPNADSRAHLVALAGESKADSLVAVQRSKLSENRSYTIPDIKGEGTADFFVLLAPGSKTEEVRFIRGDEKLKILSDKLRSYDFKPQFPDEAETRIIRRGTLSCSRTATASPVTHQATKKEKPEPTTTTPPEKGVAEGPCTFVVSTPDLVRSID